MAISELIENFFLLYDFLHFPNSRDRGDHHNHCAIQIFDGYFACSKFFVANSYDLSNKKNNFVFGTKKHIRCPETNGI